MRYSSTRGKDRGRTFEETVLNTFASDDGLFVPETIPNVDSETLRLWSKLSYVELCQVISRLFISEEEIPTIDLNQLITKAFTGTFDHEEIIPVVKVGDVHVAELWHGPTLAFKDLGQQCVGQMVEYFTAKNNRHVTIIMSTSGDTGSAAIESVRRLKAVDIIVMFPIGVCSSIQERQMTTVLDENVHIFATEGSCYDNDVVLQNYLKNPEMVKKFGLCTINSFMWARIMIHIVHYFYIYLQVCRIPGDVVEFVVPTGGAGNLAGACIAYKMGLPIKISGVTTINDIICRALQKGDYTARETINTIACAMDMKAPYNFERIVYLYGGASKAHKFMSRYDETGDSELTLDVREKISVDLSSHSVSQEQMINIIKKCWLEWNYLIDPHTATGMHVVCHEERTTSCDSCVVLATAHIDKFPETINLAGIEHEPSEKVMQLLEKPTKFIEMKKGEDWEKILMQTILAIDEKVKKLNKSP